MSRIVELLKKVQLTQFNFIDESVTEADEEDSVPVLSVECKHLLSPSSFLYELYNTSHHPHAFPYARIPRADECIPQHSS